MKANDFLTDSTGDLQIIGGDLSFGESDGQHIEDILIATKGDFKQHPLVGVNLASALNSPNSSATMITFRRTLQLQLEGDNYRVDDITLKGGIENTVISAERIK